MPKLQCCPTASFTGDGAHDQDCAAASVAARHPEAATVMPPRSNAAPSDTAETAPMQRDRRLQLVGPSRADGCVVSLGLPDIAKHGRAAWQSMSGYTIRARAVAAIGGFEQVIGDGLRSRTEEHRAAGDERRRPCPQPHAGPGTPDPRSRRPVTERIGAVAPTLLVNATPLLPRTLVTPP